MNPRVLNPDPLSILKEANKIYDPSKKPGMRDGFTIIDGDRAKGVGWASDAAYNDSIKKNFDFTSGDMEAAKAKAARDGVPLVVVVGNKNSADTKQLVDGVIPGAKGGAQKAVYVYAEMSQLDPNSELGREVAASRGDSSHPYTAIFAPKAGPDGKPQLENHIANTWGSRAEIGSIIQQQLGHAQTTMDSRKGSFNVPDGGKPVSPDGTRGPSDGSRGPSDGSRGIKPDAPVKPEATEQEKLRQQETEAEARVAPYAKTIIDSFKQLKGATYSQREGLYSQAEAAAAKLDPKDVALVKQKTSRELESEVAKGAGADQQKLDTLKARQNVLDLMANAPAWTKMNHGMSQLHFSQLDQGIAKIKEGAKENPSYLNNPQFIEQLMRTPYELSTLKEKLPEVKFDDYLKAKKEGSVDKFVAANKPPEAKPEVKPPAVQPEVKPSAVQPEVKPPTVTPEVKPPAVQPETKPELTVVQPEKLKYDGSEYEKALEDAFKSGRRLVGKVGSPDCEGCKDMTEKAWPDGRVQQNLKDKAVFTDINGEQRMDLVESLQANSWPTVVVVEPYKDEASGKIKGRVVSKIEPNTPAGRSADSLNRFLTDNLTEPKKQLVVKPSEPSAKPEAPPAVQPEVKPQVPPQPEVRPDVKPEVPPQPEADAQAKAEAQVKADQAIFERLTVNHRKILEPLKTLNDKSDAATIEAAFNSAIENAKQVRPEDIARANQLLEGKKQSIIGSITGGAPDEATKAELAKVESNLQMVKRIDQSEAYLNISRGAVKLRLTPDNPEAGKADIKAGLAMKPELAQDVNVLAKLKSTGVSDEQLKAWFPELPVQGDKPPVVPGAQRVQQAFENLREQHAKNLQPFAELPEQPTEQQITDAYAKAIESASKVNPVDVQTALSALETRRQVLVSTANANGGQMTEAAQAELNQINQDAVNYSRIGQADGLLYVSMGVRKMTANKDNPESGVADVHKGLELRPALRQDPSIMAKLASTGFDAKTLSGWFPELTQQPAPGPQPAPKPQVPPRPGSRK